MRRTDSDQLSQRREFILSGRGLLCAAALLVATGCAQCAPDRVGPGVARLTVRDVGAMVTMLNADTTCGFGSQAVLSAPTMTGTVGGQGSLTFTVAECLIDAGEGLEISRNCEDATTTASGKVTLSGTRTVKGTLTGNPLSPIIPAGPDAVTITLDKATFDNFLVVSSASKNKLRMISGSLSATINPRLAVSATTGACAIATPNVTFTDVHYAESKVFVDTPDNQFEADVSDSLISAQNGVNGDRTNDLSGTVTVFGSEVPAVQKGDTEGLDPDFELEKFEAGYACTTGLVQPVSFTCADLRPRLAGGVARLSARTIGTITSMVDANTSCGFSSAAVGGTPVMTGLLGQDGSTATFTISTACSITLPADTLLSTDCAGVTTKGTGTVSVTGTKRVTGFRTGNPAKPIVPTSRDPAQFNLSITFTNFEVKNSASTSSLLVKSGALSGKVGPRTGIDKTTGACSISTPVVTFSDLSWTDANVRLTSDGNKFDLLVGASAINVQNGTKGTVSNNISGQITVDGISHSLAVGGELLDTAFVQATFDASYTCNPNLVVAPVEAACSFRQALGTGAARLLVKNLATSNRMVNLNAGCGFSSNAVLTSGTTVGNPGSPGSVTWTVTGCAIGPLPANQLLSTNCLGTTTNGSGTITATGTKTVTGQRNTNPPIIPVTRTAATFNMTSIVFNAFELYDLPTGVTTPTSSSLLTGTGVVTVKPIGGESTANPGVYSVSTPVAAVETLTMADGTMTIKTDGNTFNVALTNVSLDAFTGSYLTNTNRVAGSLTVDGQPVTIATTLLDPTFVQATYNSTYVCTPDLVAVIPYP